MSVKVRQLIIMVLAAAAVTACTGSGAFALSGSSFQPGHIIDDQVFFDNSAMTVDQIQSFLYSEEAPCDNNGTQPYYGTYGGVTYDGNITRANLDPNYKPPYTCLYQYEENTQTHQNNVYGNIDGTSGPTALPSGSSCDMNPSDSTFGQGVCSAAQIIYYAQVTYNVSARVLLVTMEKEEGIADDDWPWWTEYRTAMGYGCPDGASCNADYYGFYNQVVNAAWQFNDYQQNPSNFNYTIGQNNIPYNPTSSCGTESVNIVDQSTADLYDYTPYVPDAAALANLDGTGDSCSSYGNRDFWRDYNNWFGSTYTPSYASQYVSESTGQVSLLPGQSTQVSITYKNVGADPWYDDTTAAANGADPVRLATARQVGRSSGFGTTAGGAWCGNSDLNRAACSFSAVIQSNGTPYATNPHVVQPGESATFTFTLAGNYMVAPGTYPEFFQPIVEGLTNMNDPGTVIDVVEQQANYSSAYAGESVSPTLQQGQSANVWLRFKNTGNATWFDDSTAAANSVNPVRLATSHALGRPSGFASTANSEWCGDSDDNRASCAFAAVYESDGVTLAANQHEAQPGEIVQFDFTMTAGLKGPTPGTYDEFFQPIVEGWTDMNDPWTFLQVNVTPATFAAAYYGESASPTLSPGSASSVWLEFKNVGNAPWYDDTAVTPGELPVRLATSHAVGRASQFADLASGGWCGDSDDNRAACGFTAVYDSDGATLASNQHVAQPGQIVKFEFNLQAPSVLNVGHYQEFFQPIVEGLTNMNDPWTFLLPTVN